MLFQMPVIPSDWRFLTVWPFSVDGAQGRCRAAPPRAGGLLWGCPAYAALGLAVCALTPPAPAGGALASAARRGPAFRGGSSVLSPLQFSPPRRLSSLRHTTSSNINVNVKATHFCFVKISLPILLNSFLFCPLSASCLLSPTIRPTGPLVLEPSVSCAL